MRRVNRHLSISPIKIAFLSLPILFVFASIAFAATANLNKTFVDFNTNGTNNITVSWSGFSGNVYIELYKNNGATGVYVYPNPAATNQPGASGSYGFGSGGWANPGIGCGYRFKVVPYSNSSLGQWATLSGAADFCIGSLTVNSPNGGETLTIGNTYNITWAYNNVTDNIRINLYQGTTVVNAISSSTINDGSFSWTIPTNFSYSGSNFKIGISNVHTSPVQNDGQVSDFSNSYFTIQSPPLLSPPTLTSPIGGAKVYQDTSGKVNLNWTNVSGNNGYLMIVDSMSPMAMSVNQTTYAASLSAGATHTWQMCTKNSAGICGTYSSPVQSFYILPTPTISSTSYSINVGDNITLSCDLSTAGAGRSVDFFINNWAGTTIASLSNVTTNSNGTYGWTRTSDSNWYPQVSVTCRDTLTQTAAAWKNITVTQPTLPPPSIVRPFSGDTLAPLPNGDVGLRWEAVSGASGYRLYIDTLPAMYMPAEQTVYNASGLGIGEHKWKACTLNASNQCGALSAEMNFTVQTAAMGFVVRTVNDPDVYWIMYGKKWKIINLTTLYGLGYTDAEIQWFEPGSLDSLPLGKTILQDNDNFVYRKQSVSTVYIVRNGASDWFFNWDTFINSEFGTQDVYWAKDTGFNWIQTVYPPGQMIGLQPRIRVVPNRLIYE